jgi:hypothetical protein
MYFKSPIPIIFIASCETDNIQKAIREIIFITRKVGGKKAFINLITDQPSWVVLREAREAILENIDLSLEIRTWNYNSAEREIMIKELRKQKAEAKGLIFYCDQNKRGIIEEVKREIPSEVMMLFMRDECSKRDDK